jgi:hypothetical protein
MADKTLPPVAIGDSLAVGMRDANKIPGLGRVGAGPREVLDMIKRFSMENSLSGRDVFIGTGMPNIPEQKKFIEEQIDFVKKQGGNPILMGVGPGTKKKPTTGQNEFLAGLAERKGLPYMGPLANSFPDITKDPMGLHLRGPQYQQIFKQYAKPQPQQQKQVQPQVQPESRAPRSADLLSQFTGAVMQAESLGKRYDKSGKLLTSKAGAMGEMQVMPGTVRDPGFGVRPAKDNSPDELARVGRDYAATMLRRYNNDPTAAAVAYNWGPGNADKWVKRGADFGALPKETQGYVTRITGQMGIPIAAKRAPAPKRADVPPVPPQKRAQAEEFDRESTLELSSRPAAPPQDQITRADVERLGPNYQAALAAMTLADSREDDDDYDDEETIAERYMERREMQMAQDDYTLEEEEPARVSPLAGLSEITYQSPFAQEEPVMMADGGEARAMMNDLEPTFGQRMGAKLSDVATKGLINVYDAARLAEGALSSKESAAEKEQQMSAAHKIYLDTFGFRGRRDPVTAEYFNPEEQKAIAALIAEKGGKKGSIQYKDYGMDKRDIKESRILSGKLDPYLSVQKSLGQFNYEFDPKTKSYRVTDQYDFNPLVDVGGRQVSSDFMGDYLSDVPGLYNKARIYAGRNMPPGTGRKVDFTVPAPVRRAEGSPVYGEVATGGITPDTMAALKNIQMPNAREMLKALGIIGKEGVSNAESVARGSVAGVPGVVGDVESVFRDDQARRFATSQEIERQYLPGRMSAPTREAQGFVEIGTAIDPSIAAKLAKPTAKATLAALKASGPQVEAALMKAAPAAQPMYAVAPDGAKMGFTGDVGRLLQDYRTGALYGVGMRSDKFYPLRDMVEKKAKDYYLTQFGKANDPFRKAVMQGEMPLFSLSNIDQYAKFMQKGPGTGMASLINSAKAGDKKAQASLEKIYDQMTNLTGYVTDAGSLEKVTKAERARMTAQQIPEELQNVNVKLGKKEPYMGSDTGKAKLYSAEETNRPLYDMQGRTTIPFLQPDYVIAALSALPAQKLKTLDFPQAVIEGTKLLNNRLAQEGRRSTSIYPKK